MAKAALTHCVDSVSEKGEKHVEHKSAVARLVPADVRKKLEAIAQEQ